MARMRRRMAFNMGAPPAPRTEYAIHTPTLYGHPDLQAWVLRWAGEDPDCSYVKRDRCVIVQVNGIKDLLVAQSLERGDLETARTWIRAWSRAQCRWCCGPLMEATLYGRFDYWWHERTGLRRCEAMSRFDWRHLDGHASHERDPMRQP